MDAIQLSFGRELKAPSVPRFLRRSSMSRFILIEPSLDRLGGHYHEYTTEILKAAESAGHEPLLAINQRFNDREQLQAHWQVFPVFPNGSASIHRVPRSYGFDSAGLNKLDASGLRNAFYRFVDSAADRLKSSINEFRWLRRLKRTARFVDACESLFKEIGFEPGDQILCSTISDMDLLGLVKFLRQTPESQKADWHLQFHFRIYSGRDPDYPKQDRGVKQLRRRFEWALRQLNHHRMSFYTTTDHLAAQYNRLNAGTFNVLPWPVSQRFLRSSTPLTKSKRLRVVCAGNVRREKGADHWRWLIDRLWNPLLKTNKIQLIFQADEKRRTQSMLGLPKDQVAHSFTVDPVQMPDAPIVSVSHPLSPNQYAELIKGADIGLLLYNADEYYVRCSGILVEFLAAGVPVIAPAGCWLGDEVDQANAAYLTDLAKGCVSAKTWNTGDLNLPGLILNIGSSPMNADIAIPNSEKLRSLLVRFNWTKPSQGTYLKVGIEQFGTNRRKIAESTIILGTRSSAALSHLEAETLEVRLSLRNAYHDSQISADSLRVDLLENAESIAAGFVGLTAADYQQVPRLIDEIHRDYQQYSNAARSFAGKWVEQHAPEKTIRLLNENSHNEGSSELRRAG